MKEPLVSVILTVYQKEKYVEECVRSFLNQSYKNIELICVEDHSSDNSGAILKQLADEDSRITLIFNSSNKGASASRNIGIDNAKGKYLSVLDADDVYDSKFIEKAVCRCEQDQLDVLLYDYYTYNDATRKKTERHIPMTIREILKDKTVFSNRDIEKISCQMCSAVGWTKMYRREFIEINKIKYQNISSSNDVLFNRLAIACAERIGYISCCWMIYRSGIVNQISNLSNEHSLNYAKAGTALKQELVSRKLYESNMQSVHTYIFTSIIAYIRYITPDKWIMYYAQIKDMLSKMIENVKNAFLSSYYEYWYQDFMGLTGYGDIDRIANEYQYIFQYEKKKINQIREYNHAKAAQVVLWGYDKNGKSFYIKCKEYGFHIDCVVDKNCMAREVSLPITLENSNSNFVVLVTTASLVQHIFNDARRIKNCIAVIDLQSYLSYGIEFDKCVSEVR